MQVKFKAMKSHEAHVKELNHQGQEIMKRADAPDSVQVDLAEFNEKWAHVFCKIGTYLR